MVDHQGKYRHIRHYFHVYELTRRLLEFSRFQLVLKCNIAFTRKSWKNITFGVIAHTLNTHDQCATLRVRQSE